MQILVNTDNSIDGSDKLADTCSARVDKALDRYRDRISRVELHLGDTNGAKTTPDDKRCSLEVRLNGMAPVAVAANGMSLEQAVDRALHKVTSAIEHTVGRLQDR